MAKTASKNRKQTPTKPKPDVAKELAGALAEKPETTSRKAASSPMPRVGDKVTFTSSRNGTAFEISRVSDGGREVDVHLPGTNLERFRVSPEDLTFVERRAPARAPEPVKPPYNAAELAERVATMQHRAVDHLSGEIAILKKFMKSKRAPQEVLDALDDLCHDIERAWSAGVKSITALLDE